jgi:hypothetical protein
VIPLVLVAILAGGCEPVPSTAVPVSPYLMMDPPPDSDKNATCTYHPDNSCWMHTAANMLAAAGYGNGNTVQDRADDIFADMAANWTDCDSYLGGWMDTALNWWLNSAHNTWTNNPYTLVTVHGNTDCTPWGDANGAQFIANELRDMNPVGLAIKWPHAESATDLRDCLGGHGITAMGDDSMTITPLTTNPGGLQVTDSDTDTGGDVQAYTYDAFTNPNPGGPNEGNGWYFDYSTNHPYLIQSVTLTRTTSGAGANSVRVVGSYRIQQTCEREATDLHYEVGTDIDILTYRTWLDVPGTPTITESQPRRTLTVDWDLSEKPIPHGEWVTISTEFVETAWNAIFYNDVHFTYPIGAQCMQLLPDLHWWMETPWIDGAEEIPSVTGGYVIGGFYLISEEQPDLPAGQYRFQHQYLYNQDPELHILLLSGTRGYTITNLTFGHSYGFLTDDQLWEFEDWMTVDKEEYPLSEDAIEIIIDWGGQLPYPEGLK